MPEKNAKKRRLFAGLELPPSALEALAKIPPLPPSFRPVPRRNLHVTLAFIGERDAEQAGIARKALGMIRCGAFDLAIRGLGFFSEKRQAVLWAGLEYSSRLVKLKGLVDEILWKQARIEPENREFLPHISLGRSRCADKRILREFTNIWGARPKAAFRVDSFALFRSELLESGPLYHLVERYPLERGDFHN